VGNVNTGIKLLFFSFISLTFGISCSVYESFSRTEQISILLPAWPPEEVSGVGYPELSGWQVSLFSSELSETFFLPAETTVLEKTVSKNDFLAVSARPVTFSTDKSYETFFFMPAGSTWPQLCHENCLHLTFEDGYASEIMKAVLLNGEKNGYSKEKIRDFLVRFNWKKFSSIINEKSGIDDVFYNPWQLDFSKTVNALTGGNFTAVKLNIKAGNEISFPEDITPPPLSPYIPENQKITQKQSLPVYTGKENRFLLENDLLLSAFSDDSKKVSDTTVFMPKKKIETVYAKKN